jgi:hypothetical protein
MLSDSARIPTAELRAHGKDRLQERNKQEQRCKQRNKQEQRNKQRNKQEQRCKQRGSIKSPVS